MPRSVTPVTKEDSLKGYEIGRGRPMEALMNRRPSTFKPTAEDFHTIRIWKLRLGLIYGAIMFVLVLVVFAGRNHGASDTAKLPGKPAFSSASATSSHPAH